MEAYEIKIKVNSESDLYNPLDETQSTLSNNMVNYLMSKIADVGSIRRSPAILHTKKGPRALTNPRSFFHLRNCSFSDPFFKISSYGTILFTAPAHRTNAPVTFRNRQCSGPLFSLRNG